MKNPEPEYIVIGTVLSSWGLHGHIKVAVETDFPQRFSSSSQIYVGRQPLIIDEVTWHKGRAIIKLGGVDTEEKAVDMVGQLLEVHRSQLFSLEEDRYFHFQLIGLEVKTTGGDILGRLEEVLTMASADVYVIKGPGGDILVPATDEFVKSIDLENGVLTIETVAGLLELNSRKAK